MKSVSHRFMCGKLYVSLIMQILWQAAHHHFFSVSSLMTHFIISSHIRLLEFSTVTLALPYQLNYSSLTSLVIQIQKLQYLFH